MEKLAAHQIALVLWLTDIAAQHCECESDSMSAELELGMTAESGLIMTAEFELSMAEPALRMAAECELVMPAEFVQHHVDGPDQYHLCPRLENSHQHC